MWWWGWMKEAFTLSPLSSWQAEFSPCWHESKRTFPSSHHLQHLEGRPLNLARQENRAGFGGVAVGEPDLRAWEQEICPNPFWFLQRVSLLMWCWTACNDDERELVSDRIHQTPGYKTRALSWLNLTSPPSMMCWSKWRGQSCRTKDTVSAWQSTMSKKSPNEG